MNRIKNMMNRKPLWLGALGIGMAGVAALLLDLAAEKPAASPAAQAKAALTVTAVQPVAAEWPEILSANGNILAWQEAIIGAEANGLRLTEVVANVGDRVKKGQVLARLQSETTAAELAQAKAGLAEAEATLAEARANADRARSIEKSGALSAQQVAQHLTAEQTAAARVESFKAQVQAAQVRLGQTRIVAPDDGTITARTATLGAVVQPGQELFRLIRRDRLEWRAELPSAELARIKPGMEVKIVTASKNTVRGKVRMVAPTVEQQTRNGLVYVDLQEVADARAGMFARGEIALGQGKVLTLPQTAVLLRDGFSYVYRLDKDNRVIQTKVRIGQRSGDRVAIAAGLEAWARVVATGVGFLADGDLVRVSTGK